MPSLRRFWLLPSLALLAGCATFPDLSALPAVGFCGDLASPKDLAKLAEGPALFVDAVRIVAQEVGQQSSSVGNGMQKGLNVTQRAMEALGSYRYEGAGSYRRDAASDRAFRLRLFYGDGVPGKTAGQPLEADVTKLDSYLPAGGFLDLLNPTAAKGPLFPLIESTGLSSGALKLKDGALRFDLASLLKTQMKGYDLQFALGTRPGSIGEVLDKLKQGKLDFSLADTAMRQEALGFNLTVKKFDLTYGLDGTPTLGGDYLFEVQNGGLRYYGAVQTLGGVPTCSLRCSEAAASEFATLSFGEGKADCKVRMENFPISLPGLAPSKP